MASELVVVGEDHPAATGGQDLVPVEAEYAQPAEGAGVCTTGAAAQRLRGILHDWQVVFRGERGEFCDAHRMSERVHRDDRTDPPAGGDIHQAVRCRRRGPQDVRHGIHRHAQRFRITVDEVGPCADVTDGVGCRDERKRRHDHIVARTYAGELERDLESRGAVRDRDPVRGSGECCDAALELRDEGADAGHECRIQALLHALLLDRRDVGDMQADERLVAHHVAQRGDNLCCGPHTT